MHDTNFVPSAGGYFKPYEKVADLDAVLDEPPSGVSHFIGTVEDGTTDDMAVLAQQTRPLAA